MNQASNEAGGDDSNGLLIIGFIPVQEELLLAHTTISGRFISFSFRMKMCGEIYSFY